MTKNTYTAILEIEVPKKLGWIRGEEAEEYLKETVKELLKTNNLKFRSSYDTRNGKRISHRLNDLQQKMLILKDNQTRRKNEQSS